MDDAAANDVLFNSYSQETLVSTAMSKVYDRSLEGKVFIDKNKDGIFNNDDIEVKNTKVILYKKDGTKVAEQLTDENGNYKFEKL
ncbi:SdrD B-like domain-containing protein, partial [Acinetobacter baumannii]